MASQSQQHYPRNCAPRPVTECAQCGEQLFVPEWSNTLMIAACAICGNAKTAATPLRPLFLFAEIAASQEKASSSLTAAFEAARVAGRSGLSAYVRAPAGNFSAASSVATAFLELFAVLSVPVDYLTTPLDMASGKARRSSIVGTANHAEN